ncbi:MAG: sodium ion-translocating decarboxylase subunit beta [Treponema sp.]|nr:sodium ion-translocating decarboxylase subunit beta [Treponema sp.]MDY2924078.1 sodium ion-translocating decarboxylase subunit beta [Treponema sp.]
MERIFLYFAQGFCSMQWQQFVMLGIGFILIGLAVVKNYEPMLLLPIGFGTILVNLPFAVVLETAEHSGALKILFDCGILTELFPLLIFIGVGAMIDFTPLLERPWLFVFGLVAHFGIFVAAAIAYFCFGFSVKESFSIGIIGAADGPTAIVVATRHAPSLLGPVTVAAYSYMSLVPIIMPPVIKLLTSEKERKIHIQAKNKKISRKVAVFFPVALTVFAGILIPDAAALVGFLMFGNLIRECGVLEKLSKAAQNELSNIVTLLLGISVGSCMTYDRFLTAQTLLIMILGLIAFTFDTICGVLFAKFLNLFRKKGNKLNPMIGACGISAFPMASRVVQKIALEEDSQNFILMHAVSANVSGQIGSVIIGGIILGCI